jgi:hypothetical protein
MYNYVYVFAGYNGFVTCLDGFEVVCSVYEDSKPGASSYGLICFVYGDHAIRIRDMEQSARRDAVCRSLVKFYESEEALEVK